MQKRVSVCALFRPDSGEVAEQMAEASVRQLASSRYQY